MSLTRVLLVAWFIVLSVSFYLLCTKVHAQTFTQTKQELMTLYASHPYTFYCHCRFDPSKHINCNHSLFTCRNTSSRCSRVEFDNLLPAYDFGYFRPCWKTPLCKTKTGRTYKGRACCERIDKQFALIEADPHNLVPVIGQINGDRRDYLFGKLHEKPYQYGACQVEIDRQKHIIQPPPDTKGWIARDYFYMHKKYHLPLTKEQIVLYSRWDKQYSPSVWELKLNQELDYAGKGSVAKPKNSF